MLVQKEANPKFLWIKVAVMVMALIGVFWARSSLDRTAAQPKDVEEIAPIPAKVETGK